MSSLLPSLLILFVVVGLTLWAGGVFIQGYLYTEPVAQAYWRAPLAGLVLTLYVSFWCYLDYKNPGDYNALFEFSTTKVEVFPRFWSIKNGQKTLFQTKTTGRGREYRDQQNRVWSRSSPDGMVVAIEIEDKDKNPIRFEAELTPEGKFVASPDQAVRYVEAKGNGRVMTDAQIGIVSTSRPGLKLLNWVLNLMHLAVWFLVLWVLLRFTWTHSLGFALVLWAILTFVLPALFQKTEDAARQKAEGAVPARIVFAVSIRALPHRALSTSCADRFRPSPQTQLCRWRSTSCALITPIKMPA